jgi:hypothetical protein
MPAPLHLSGNARGRRSLRPQANLAMESLPLAYGPQHVPIWASATALSEALGLPPLALSLFLGLGSYFLSFLPNGLGIRKYSIFGVVVASPIGRIFLREW